MMATNTVYPAEHLGVFTPKSTPRDELRAGEVGFIIAGIKELAAAKVGDTVTIEKKLPNNAGPATEALPGFKEIQPQVFAGLYPTEASEYDQLRDAARCATSPRCRRRWALAFAAASWACCTWRSCRSAWSASSIRT
jgi:translation elongation factor EF-4